MKNTLFTILAITLLGACGQKSGSDVTTEQNDVTPAVEQSVSLRREQIQKSGISWSPVERHEISPTITANGTVVVLPQNKAAVSSKIDGRIEQFLVQEGQNVQKGQVLMSITSSAIFDIQQAYLQARADLIFLEKELERQKTLSGQQVGATKNYEEARSKYARATGDMQTAAAKLRYLGISTEQLNSHEQPQLARSVTITAPISGNISSIAVNLGASVSEGAALCNIVGLDDLHAHFEIFAKDISQIRAGQQASIRFNNLDAPPLVSKVEFISKEMSPETRTYSVHIPLANAAKNGYLPGMPLSAEIQLSGGSTMLAIPESAVLHDGTQTYCFVVTEKDADNLMFEKVMFEPAVQGGGWVGLPVGLLAGKQVVTQGANLIDGAMRKGDME